MKPFDEIPWDKLDINKLGEEWYFLKWNYGNPNENYIISIFNGVDFNQYECPEALSLVIDSLIKKEREDIITKIRSKIFQGLL